jgi:hypothetical protein
MNDTDRLLAVEEIRKLKARYFRLMDMKQWSAAWTWSCETELTALCTFNWQSTRLRVLSSVHRPARADSTMDRGISIYYRRK